MDLRIIDYINRRKDVAKGIYDERHADYDFCFPELSWRIYTIMESVEWRVLPFPGGLLDQPEWMWHDLGLIGWLHKITEQDMEMEAELQQTQ